MKLNKIEQLKQYLDQTGVVIPADGIEALKNMGYFFLPASLNYHGAKEGGLFDHSLAVAKHLMKLTECLNLTWKRRESPVLVGLLHDLCKVDDYQFEVKDPGQLLFGSSEITGRTYEFSRRPDEERIDSGHGMKSVLIASELGMALTPEEVACIRWHMGAFDDRANWQYYTKAIEHNPNVLYTHMADMIASHIDYL